MRAPSRRLLAALLAATALGGIVAWERHGIPEVALLPPDDPFVRLEREITAEFGMQSPVIWVLEARDGSVWTPPILSRLRALTREVLTIPGVIATDVVSLASPNLRDLRVTDEGLEPIYLMGDVPATPEALARLRRRVEDDPNYHGTLVSTDGRAAMVVANFRDDADPVAVGRAALAVRDRHRDASTMAYSTGTTVLRVLGASAARGVALPGAAVVLAALALAGRLLGARAALAAALAGLLACLWTGLACALTGTLTLPWTAYALPAPMLLAAAIALAGGGWWLAPLALGLALGHGLLALQLPFPASDFALTGAIGGIAAVAAGIAVHAAAGARLEPLAIPWAPRAALVAAIAGLAGLPRLDAAFGLLGHAERYLPGTAAEDVRAVGRLFPPPTMLALRARGQPGFVAEPDVLEAFDGVAHAARADAATIGVMTLADIVKMVHRAFNEDRAEFQVIPAERALVARYLALAYSPGFRRFVDRALARSALWISLSGARPADLERVLGRAREQLAARPVPTADVDVAGGDGAAVLVMARLAGRLAAGTGALVLIFAAIASGFRRADVAWRSLLGAAVATAVAAGGLGWLGLPIDLVSLPAVTAAAVAGAALGALASLGDGAALLRLAATLAGVGLAALLMPIALLRLLGLVLLAPAVGTWLASASAPQRAAGASES